MCNRAHVDGKNIYTVGKLKEYCPTIISVSIADELSDSECLCSVDIPATAEANGYAAVEDSEWVGDYELSRKP